MCIAIVQWGYQVLADIQALESKGVKVAKDTILADLIARLCKFYLGNKDWDNVFAVLSSEESAHLGVQACHLSEDACNELQLKLLPKIATDILTQTNRDSDVAPFCTAYTSAYNIWFACAGLVFALCFICMFYLFIVSYLFYVRTCLFAYLFFCFMFMFMCFVLFMLLCVFMVFDAGL